MKSCLIRHTSFSPTRMIYYFPPLTINSFKLLVSVFSFSFFCHAKSFSWAAIHRERWTELVNNLWPVNLSARKAGWLVVSSPSSASSTTKGFPWNLRGTRKLSLSSTREQRGDICYFPRLYHFQWARDVSFFFFFLLLPSCPVFFFRLRVKIIKTDRCAPLCLRHCWPRPIPNSCGGSYKLFIKGKILFYSRSK